VYTIARMTRSAAPRAGLCLTLVLGALAGCSPPAGGGAVTILVAWGGTALTAFRDTVIRGFEARYPGTTVRVEATRALSSQLDTELQQGDPPDVAALPSIGAIRQYASQGALRPLDGLAGNAAYGQPWQSLMRPQPDGRIYAVPVKADVKSLIWYDPATLRQELPALRLPARTVPPQTLPQLAALSTALARSGHAPWCLAVSSPPTSGWPGADWIADLLLAGEGPQAYQAWADGRLPWTSPQVAGAWRAWDALVGPDGAVHGGRASALSTAIGKARPAGGGCFLSHGTLVDQGFSPGARYGSDYGFFPFPSGGSTPGAGPVQVSADFVGMFRATPAAENLVSYMTSAGAQRAWVGYRGADGFSPSSQVRPDAYPDAVTRSIAALLTSGRRLCFGAADAMSPDLAAAFDHAVLWYLAQPSALATTILPQLARVPAAAGGAPRLCGAPR
jgi:alpha-glucoside transport system substrate-binding protein